MLMMTVIWLKSILDIMVRRILRKTIRFGFFPSIALGYNISQEKFWEPISNVISHFKLRGSYGLVGNDGINERYAYLEDIVLSSDKWKYTTGVNQNVNLQGPVWNRYYNPNLLGR